MIRGIRLSLLLLCFPVWAQAATYYIDDTGSNTNSGTSAAPWLTWAYAFAKSKCGDTLIVMDGTYTKAKHGNFSLAKTCTATTVYTVKAQNERQAFLSGNGTTPLSITSSAYITVQGLRVKNIDSTVSGGGSNVAVRDSNHITLRRLLVTHNNRYINSHLILLARSPYSLVEENELYFFHRHGIIFNNTNNSVVRRTYCHARNYADIPGGYPSGVAATGDDCIALYPGDNNIIENNISDGPMSKAFAVEALNGGRGNKFYGNIAIGASIGLSLDVRGAGSTNMPRDSVIENMVVVSPSSIGIRSLGAKNTRCDQCMVIFSRKHGLLVDADPAAPGDGSYSFFSSNSLALTNGDTGFYVTNKIQTWSVSTPNAFKNVRNYTPVSGANWVNLKSADPALGACRIWIPVTSPMKRAGIDGKDIGANILYRYQNGGLTKVPLWNPSTGGFPRGALVSGLNNIAGQSLFDVHKRLNVNSNGCSFPAGYGSGTTTISAPTTLQVSS